MGNSRKKAIGQNIKQIKKKEKQGTHRYTDGRLQCKNKTERKTVEKKMRVKKQRKA